MDTPSTSIITFAGSSGEQAQPSGNPAIPANHQPADINPVAPQLPSQGVQQTPLEPAAPPPSHASIPIIDSAAAVSTSSAAPPLPHSTTQAAPSQQPPSSPAAGGEGPQASPHPRSHARSTTEALPAVPLGGSNAAAAAPGCASERGSGGAAQHLTALSSAASADWGARKYMEDRWVIQEDARQRREGRTRWVGLWFRQSASRITQIQLPWFCQSEWLQNQLPTGSCQGVAPVRYHTVRK